MYAPMAWPRLQTRASATAVWTLVLLVAAVMLAHVPAVAANERLCTQSARYDIWGQDNYVF